MPFASTQSVPLPPEFDEIADEENAAIDDALNVVIPAPDRPYNPKVVTSLGKAVAKVAALLGLDLGDGEFTGPVEELDPDLVRFLVVVSKAAEEYGQPLPVALEDIRGDAELTTLAAAITSLSTDRDFKDFLNQDVPDSEPGLPEDEDDEGPAAGDEDDEDFDFASRLMV